MRPVLTALLLAGVALSAAAAQERPYAGLQSRPIKALSEQQIADLKTGRGMSLALAAELNGYPGPAHVLELADRLGLSGEQRTRVQALFDGMKSEAIPIGERLIELETALDRQFADRAATPASLSAALTSIGETQAALRNAHLKYHLMTLPLLTPAQTERYAELRGYRAGGGMHDPSHHNKQ